MIIVLRVYIYDPSLTKKCSHKDKPIVEMPICTKMCRKKKKINTLKNKSKIIEISVNYRYVNQKCKISSAAIYP